MYSYRQSWRLLGPGIRDDFQNMIIDNAILVVAHENLVLSTATGKPLSPNRRKPEPSGGRTHKSPVGNPVCTLAIPLCIDQSP